MQRPILRIAAILIVAGGPAAAECRAQIGRRFSSIEWLTASSDVIVEATIMDLAYADRDPQVPGTESQWQRVTVTLSVRAALKGKPLEPIALTVEQPRGSRTLPEWKESKQPLLWFLVIEDQDDDSQDAARDDSDAGAGKRPAPKLRPREESSGLLDVSVVELASRISKGRIPRPMFSMDLRILVDQDTLREAIKSEIARQESGRSECSHSIPLPYEVAARTGRAGDVNVLVVPVNERLERLAREWARSPEDWIRRASRKTLERFTKRSHSQQDER